MPYTPPAGNNADFTWLGESSYSPPSSSDVEFSWVEGLGEPIQVTLSATSAISCSLIRSLNLHLNASIAVSAARSQITHLLLLAQQSALASNSSVIAKFLLALLPTTASFLLKRIAIVIEERLWARSIRRVLVARSESEPDVVRSKRDLKWGRQITNLIIGRKE
jgi:hypothetical protein